MVDTIKSKLAEGRTQHRPEIRQGVKSTVETTPVPVRLEVEQVKMLKVLAALEGTTVSNIIRDCIREYIETKMGSEGAIHQTILDRFGPPTKP
jgi:hypothetical protein